uniref:Uncharacterized protein n=1 Tax=Schizaphis graminum TaxID=13262 RepID=A0A2S2PMT2_SCHGA
MWTKTKMIKNYLALHEIIRIEEMEDLCEIGMMVHHLNVGPCLVEAMKNAREEYLVQETMTVVVGIVVEVPVVAVLLIKISKMVQEMESALLLTGTHLESEKYLHQMIKVEEVHGVPVALKTPRINERPSDFKMTVNEIIRLHFFFF